MTNLDSIFKSREITLPTKVCLVKAMVFPVVMYGWESWTIKKAEHWRIDAFELWCWRRLLIVLWTARRSNQSILKEVSPGCSLEGLCWSWNSNILATWCKELTHCKRPWCWERLRARREGDDRGWDSWMASLTRWTWVWVDSGNWWGRVCCVHVVAKSQTWLSDWTDLYWGAKIPRALEHLSPWATTQALKPWLESPCATTKRSCMAQQRFCMLQLIPNAVK